MVIENVIIELTCEGNGFDIELPANVKISEIKPILRNAMMKKGIGLSDNFNLFSTDGYLNDNDTLLDAGVWDGRNITII